MAINNRPNAYGTYNDPVCPNNYGVGTVASPHDGSYSAYCYGEDKRIYWDGPRCADYNYWTKEEL